MLFLTPTNSVKALKALEKKLKKIVRPNKCARKMPWTVGNGKG